MNNPEQKIGGAAKVDEYIERIKAAKEREAAGEPGETTDQIIAGLTPLFREAVNAELGFDNERNEDDDKESEEDVLLAQESKLETKRLVQEDEKNSARRANEIRVELGLPIQLIEQPLVEMPEDQESEASIPKLENVAIKENDQLAARNFDISRFEFKNENGKVVEYYRGADSYRREIDGNLAEAMVGDRKLKIIFLADPSIHASYVPSRDYYTIGPGAVEEYKKDPELFLSSLNHEIAHGSYFSLPAEKQKSLDDLFLADEGLRQNLMEFAATLYSDKYQIGDKTGGEMYLQLQDINNQDAINNLLSKDAFPGIKDFRSVSFELNGVKHETFLSQIITEMISYMSSLQLGENVYQKVAENGRQRRGGEDPRYEAVAKMFKALNNNPKIKAEIDSYDLFPATTEKAKNDLLAMMEKI